MNITICNKMYVSKMTSMSSSSQEQNDALKRCIKCGEINLSDCYILLDHDEIKARAVIFRKIAYIGYLTIEDIATLDLLHFMQEIIKHLTPKQTWSCDLYSDKQYFPIIKQALDQCFSSCIKRESYTIQTHAIDITAYTYTDCRVLRKQELLSLIQDVNHSSLDTLIQNDIQHYGSLPYAKRFLRELSENEEKRKMFLILWNQNQIIGFVCMQRFTTDIGGISYIGVRRQFQSHMYSHVLLKIAINFAYQNNISKLIADIDTKNIPIRKSLCACGFIKDCKQLVYEKKVE